MNDDFLALENVKAEKFDELAGLLDLFDGKVSLNDLLNQEIPILNALSTAKQKLNTQVAQARKKKQQQVTQQQMSGKK